MLLVFSDPACGPCDTLAPELEQLSRRPGGPQVIMISRGAADVNRTKMREHGVTFPVVLQRQWEVSRVYGMFATPIAYLVDERGVIAADVAVGVDSIVNMLSPASSRVHGHCLPAALSVKTTPPEPPRLSPEPSTNHPRII